MNKSSDSARDEIIQAWIKCNGETNHSNKDKIVKFTNYIIAEAQEEVKSCQEELRLCQQDTINIQAELATEIDECKTIKQVAFDLQRQLRAAQTKIDALMLEYCPDEMTPEQVANWQAHQQTVAMGKSK